MDISKASNFERFVFDLVDRNADTVNELWQHVDSKVGFDLSDKKAVVADKYGFVAGKSSHTDRLATIKTLADSDNDIIDPHTADGVKVALELRDDDETIICLETALAAKFASTIHESLGEVTIPRPENLKGLENLPQHVEVVENNEQAVRQIIARELA